ncbi:unnamed protein product (macronuclear) [Paramecium tetraurelia]|uniref:Lebercilin domain-containing protein n=1 Tax=Paramecium tetraurelia TaxID=5888 RepID=A0C036_PARTE|nr:uncharacterized protein GSPATT00006006001 [Paramecium tetraurelia]CAK64153.1 unnamed protein product [Paramecium tetraurelia]|eukprot:XP_001431551.1 hypothetical protein (macronuclear) [Paramecium tetraurelia strain d4-2]
MNYQQEKRNSVIRQDNVRASLTQLMQSPQKQEIIQSNERHTGCIERMRVLTQELQRMTEALRQKNEDVIYLQKEIQYAKQNQQNNQGNEDLIQKLQLERQKLDQFKQMKDQQLGELEVELNTVHKELKDERLQKLDYVNRYQKQCDEVVRLQKELEKANQYAVNPQEIDQLHGHIDDLQHENEELRSKMNSLSNKVQQQQQQIAILEDQLTQQSFQPSKQPPSGPTSYQLPQMQYQQQILPQTSNYQKTTTYTVESKGTNKPTEVRKQVVSTVNGKTDVYEYSSAQDPLNPRESISSKLDQINQKVNQTYEVRNSQLQNNTSSSQLQRGSKFLPEAYQKDFNDLKSKIETKPVTEYKTTTVTKTNNKYQKY